MATKKKFHEPLSTAMQPLSDAEKLVPRVDGVILVSAPVSNYNGDPDAEGAPRIDADGYGIISNVSIHRKIRDTILMMANNPAISMFKDDLDHNQIFVLPNSIRTEQTLKVLDLDPKSNLAKVFASYDNTSDKKEESSEKSNKAPMATREERAMVANKVCESYIDTRLFGQVLNVGGVTGAMHFEHAFSVDPVEIQDMGITTGQVANKKEAKEKVGTMGRTRFVKYALFPLRFHLNPEYARLNHLTYKDYENVLEVLKFVFSMTNSANRHMQLERMFIFEHDNPLGSMPDAKLRKVVQIEKTTEIPNSFDDYKVVLDTEMLKQYPGITVKEY